MRQWFLGREPREQRMLLAGAAVLVALILYAGAWAPLQHQSQRLRVVVEQQRADLGWMRQATAELERLRHTTSAAGERGSSQSLLGIVDSTSAEAGLRPSVRRIEPQGSDRVQVWIESAPFDGLMRWLAELHTQHSARPIAASVERRETPGKVDARLTLQRTGGP